MSVVSPRDFSEISRSQSGTEAGLPPVSLVLPEVRQSGAAAGEASVALVPRHLWAFYSPKGRQVEFQPVGGLPKRLFDIAVASAALLLLAPLLLTIAGAIKLLTGGDAIYRHRRVGYSGKYFSCLKFRTMVPNGDEVLQRHLENNPVAADEWRRMRKLARDPRITGLGYFLRKTSLDELPQLINILRGDMSCVGPRPIVAEELHFYGDCAFEYFRARPGVTGLWQVSGRSLATYEERVNYDLQYVRDWSLTSDLAILLRTIPTVLNTEQAA